MGRVTKVIIDHRGGVVCERVDTSTHLCYKWRSSLAWKQCKDCPMQKLIIKTPMNTVRLIVSD